MLTAETHISLFYTVALKGNLALLPRLFTFLSRERAAVQGLSLLVDMGCACTPEAWICQATDGRAMLVAMDSMGYDAFHIGARDPLYQAPHIVEALQRLIVTRFAAGPWSVLVKRQGVQVALANGAQMARAAAELPEADLLIGLRYSEQAAVQAEWQAPQRRLLFDCGETHAQIGRLDVKIAPTAPYIELIAHRALTLPDHTPPHPTISGVIDFVQSEARYAERKRRRS
ncbi:MAG: hypothetical protein CUN49_03475 [Candidatus Thermofonsia Clade 1 bacterium]|jgi:hypothetical protein|uniref:Uncharacterized protein n=1 Tax=Candidatus Thermofonsia Clade 1 bacterium TaxID=2364210 RepID=A0A2M8PGZ6_9CHLR|nr:MAG: hypothetical protein CUN49_03475 [Candidatus Thermofonsia Clade 1 bacterium]